MNSRDRRLPIDSYHVLDRDFDPLIQRIRQLAGHRGYDRSALVSPMLKRLMPVGKLSGDGSADSAELRKRLKGAALDHKAIAYLTDSLDIELDFARLRLT